MILSGRDVKWYIEQHKLIINPINDNQFQQNGVDLILEKVDTTHDKLYANTFYLGRTREWLEMPDDIMAFVELRSTWARSGIILPPTIVDAGFKGTLTLEIFNCQTKPIPVGERFAHLIFAKMTGPSEPYSGKYQGQVDITGPIKDK